MLSDLQGFLDFSMLNTDLLADRIEYALDINGQFADRYDVKVFPSYLIENKGISKKVDGYVDLFRFNLERFIN